MSFERERIPTPLGEPASKSGLKPSSSALSRTRRARIVFACLAIWTVLVGLALWWLLGDKAGPSVWIVQDSDPAQRPAFERFYATFRSDHGLQRIYPWLLFGPYVALAALYFPLERGRFRFNLPFNLAVCAAFILGCYWLNDRTMIAGSKVVMVKTDHHFDALTGIERTNMARIEIATSGAMKPSQEEIERILAGQGPIYGSQMRTTVLAGGGFGGHQLTNFLQTQARKIPVGAGPPALRSRLLPTLLDLLAYGAVIGIAHAVHFYRRFRERERSALFLESTLANARLNALRAQLQPHFLFNSLNAIAALLRRDPRLAESTLLSLSDLLRLALNQSERQKISLREEIQFVERYLAIQQTRFGEKLRVEQNIEPETLDCLVPTLLLQPLVENAIQHGIEPAEKAGFVRITARREDQKVVLTVEDDGVGLSASRSRPGNGVQPSNPQRNGGTGIGLKNLKARLETLYGPNHVLELSERPEGGVMVRIELPWQLETEATAELHHS